MNIPLLREIQATILAEPDAFRMDTFTCGTAHCIAGHALIKCGYEIVNPADPAPMQRTEDDEQPWDVAIELLEIDWDRGVNLFEVDYWPSDLARSYFRTSDRRERAQIAVERIDRFIQSGGAE